MDDADRFRLLHGPYSPPVFRRGDKVDCAHRGREVVVGGMSDGRIQWPMARGKGAPSLIVCDDLARAVRAESVSAVCHWWGVSRVTVAKWRKSLAVEMANEGTRRLYRDRLPEKMSPEIVEKRNRTIRSPEVRLKNSLAMRGRAPHPNSIAAVRESWKSRRGGGNDPMPADTATTTGGRLKAARLSAGLSQRELATRLGVTKSYVSQVETGHRDPTLDWLHAAAGAIGCPPSNLDERLAAGRPG